MIKLCRLPRCSVVTQIAGLRKSLRNVVRICRALEILEMARNACIRRQVEVVVGMAIGAGPRWNRVRSRQREIDAIVVESRWRPARCRVARVARCREIQGHMARIRRALKIFHVATRACRVSQRVVVVDMAIRARAWRHCVHPSEREPGAVVVEGRIGPVAGAMALLAGLRETGGDVVRIRGALEVFQVAAHARHVGDGVVVVGVTVGALPRRHGMHSREREIRKVVVKRCVCPVARIVALLASLREIRADVVRIRGALEILQVTGYACRAAQCVVIVDVAISALARRYCMGTGQREPRTGVVELAVCPLHRIVALLASCRKAVVRYRSGRAGKVLLVTPDAGSHAQVVVIVHVAVHALARRISVSTGQKESCRAVVKLRVEPVISSVASFAGGRELGRYVVRIVCSGKVRLVAGIARRGHDLELAGRPAFVAEVAIDGSMGACQRKAIIVLLYVLDRNLPAPNCVALLTISSELTLVDIGMAILATFADIRKDHLYVAGRAGYG